MRLVGLIIGLLIPALTAPAVAQQVFATSFFNPTGLEGDSDLSGVLRIDLTDGSAETFIPVRAQDETEGLNQPTDVVVDEVSNTLFVSSLEGQVWHYDATTGAPRPSVVPGAAPGTFTQLPAIPVGPGDPVPQGASALAIRDGELLVGSAFGGVFSFDLSTGAPGAPLANPFSFSFPSGISVARSGEVIVATGNPQDLGQPTAQGQLFDLTQSVTTPIVDGSSGLSPLPTASPTVVAPQGDYDLNGVVNRDDYDTWFADFGTDAARSDGNGDGIVDAADYAVWRDTLGEESRIVVADGASNRLLEFALDGTDGQVLAVIPPENPVPDAPGLPSNFPGEVLVTPSGTLLVGVQGVNQRGSNNQGALLEFSRDGELLQTIASGLVPIASVAFAPSSPATLAVPEPASGLLLALAALATPRRRR